MVLFLFCLVLSLRKRDYDVADDECLCWHSDLCCSLEERSSIERGSSLLHLLQITTVVAALGGCPALRLEVLLRANAEDEDALTLGAFKLSRLRLLILLCLEARSTALARLHTLCSEELLLLLREEELGGTVAALDGATSWRFRLNTNNLHLLVALLLVNLCLVLNCESGIYHRLLLGVTLLVELVELTSDGSVVTSLELLLQRGDHLLNCEGRHSLDVLGGHSIQGRS